jgi:hypothetical protein
LALLIWSDQLVCCPAHRGAQMSAVMCGEGALMQLGMCVARGRETGRTRGHPHASGAVALREITRPRGAATWSPDLSNPAPNMRGCGHLFQTLLGRVWTLEHEMRNTVWLWYKKSFNSTKQIHLWSATNGTQYNFRPVLVVKKVLCGSSGIWIDLKTVHNGTKQTHTTQIPSWKVQNKPTPHQYRPEKIR